jgi:hypothetical protein
MIVTSKIIGWVGCAAHIGYLTKASSTGFRKLHSYYIFSYESGKGKYVAEFNILKTFPLGTKKPSAFSSLFFF